MMITSLFRDPPKPRAFEVFTRLPDKYRRHDGLTDWSRANRLGQPGDSFLEGPVFDSAGNLFVTDIEYGRIFRIDATGQWELIVEYDGEPNGMKFASSTELVVTDYKRGLMLVDVDEGSVRPLLERRNTERFRGVNDLVFDRSGNLYFTDQGQSGLHDPTGRVYRLRPSGQLDLLLSNAPSPNGIVLSPDQKVLYIAMTRGNCVWRAPLMVDGSLSKVGQFFTTAGPPGPDGLAVNADDGLVVANPGLGVVWILDHLAQPVDVLYSPGGPLPTNIAFGGPDRRSLYCTESHSGQILRATVDVPGCSLPVPGQTAGLSLES
jgi:gluconolactonase